MGRGRGGRTNLENRHWIMKYTKESILLGASQKSCCNLIGISVRTFERWKKTPFKKDQRAGPKSWKHKLTIEEKEYMKIIANGPEYRDLTPNQLVPKLADKGVYIASERSFYRVLKEAKMNKHRGKSAAKRSRKPLHLVASKPNQVWSWDITYLHSPIRGEYYYLYLVMDIYSRAIVGWSLHTEQTSDLSSKLIDKCCINEGIRKNQLTLHSDNGSPMKGATMLATLQKLGVVASFNRPSVSSDNPFSESLFKTLKYRPGYPDKAFKSVIECNEWIGKFVEWYNYTHLHSEISYTTPMSRHLNKDKQILENRKVVYTRAKELHPLRWMNKIRDWNKIEKVSLNPEKVVKRYYEVA